MKKESEFKKLYSKSSLAIVAIVIVAGIVAYLYFVGLPVSKCNGLNCYIENLDNCKRSSLIYDDENYVYRYEIQGKNGKDHCDVEVLLMQVKTGNLDAEDFEGLSMDCKVNRNARALPSSDMSICTGRLREELQEVIINRMHSQVLQNLGEIAGA